MRKKRFFGNYKKTIGATQSEAVELYLDNGKTVDEIQQLLKCPRSSIRGRISEIKKRRREMASQEVIV